MQLKKWAPAVLAIVLGGIAAKLARDSMIKSRATPAANVAATIQVAVAASDLMAEQELRAESLTITTIPAPTGALDYVVNPAEILGRVLSVPMVKGQTILLSNLKPRGASGGIASLVPAGMRAMTIVVDEPNSISGMLLPGCHVDVIATFSAGKKTSSRTVIKNALVQAVGQRLTSAKPEDGKEAPPYHAITLIVSPQEAQLIELTSAAARMRLVLRPLGRNGSVEETDPGNTLLSDLTGVNDEDKVVAVTTPTTPTTNPATEVPELAIRTTKRTVELIKGGGATVKVQFEMPQPVEAGIDARQAIPGEEFRPSTPSAEERE
jgi:pilus assembly protein CpaB